MNEKKCYRCIHKDLPYSICYICEDGDTCFEENKEIKELENKEVKEDGHKNS